ncbi:MAG: molybdopterin cofactor-binding domain-containing protein [Oceanicoccus sp.]
MKLKSQTGITQLDRREFLKLSGVSASGLLLAAHLPLAMAENQATFDPSLFLAIDAAGVVHVTVARSEMGQGILTSMAQIVADELEADWSRVKIVQAEGHEKYGDQNTDGSHSITDGFMPMRQVGASARVMLEQAAAEQWGVAVSECHAEQHQVTHQPSGKSLDYSVLVAAAAKQKLPDTDSLTLKSADQFRYIGKGLALKNLRDFTVGTADYGIDTQLPGMLYASIERPPVIKTKVKWFDKTAAMKVNGVHAVIEIPHSPGPALFNPAGGIAVIADNTWAAMKGRKALKIEWTENEHSKDNSAEYLDELRKTARSPGIVARVEGDVDAALKSAASTVEAEYSVPYLAHASMEPPAATAHYQDGFCEVWACTQTPQRARQIVAAFTDLDKEQVKVNVTLLGGAFGRKSKPDYVAEAAFLSKATGKPIKVTWTREDDIKHDYYHFISAHHMEAGLDASGKPSAWLHRAIYPDIGTTFAPQANNVGNLIQGVSNMWYDIPNVRAEGGAPDAHLRIGWVRSVGNIQNAFAVGSFTAELAEKAGRDAGEYLLELLGEPRILTMGKGPSGNALSRGPIDMGRMRGVTEKVMKAANWGGALPTNHGLGVAVHYSFLSYVATVVEVSASADGKIKVEKIYSAIDAGQVVNTDRVKAQLEGAATFGMSIAMYGEISTKNGQVEQDNYHNYQVARINEVPEIETFIIESTAAPTGVGEPGTPPLAPALANAVFAATGKRIRDLPLVNHGLV